MPVISESFCSCCGVTTKVDQLEQVITRGGLIQYWCHECIKNVHRCTKCNIAISSNVLYYPDGCKHPEHKTLCKSCYEKEYGKALSDAEKIRTHSGSYSRKIVGTSDIMQLYGYHEYLQLIPGDRVWRTRIANDDGTPNEEYNNLLPNSSKIRELNYPLLGVELEMSGAGLSAKHAYEISTEIGFATTTSTELKFARDGSLPDGLELITMPGNLNYHTKVLNWENGFKKAAQLGYRSHDSGICGLHVHVNRSFFNEEKDLTEDKLTTFIYNNSEWLKAFSRRVDFSYCKFIDKYPAENNTMKFKHKNIKSFKDWEKLKSDFEELDRAKRFNYDHHSAISFTPNRTIEFRFFRGTLVYKTFVAALQLVDVICKLIKNNDITKVEKIRLRHIIKLANELHYQEMIDYIKEKGCAKIEKNYFYVSDDDENALTEQNVDAESLVPTTKKTQSWEEFFEELLRHTEEVNF